ncbi:MAG: methionyl-tRNA formyltransferase [Gemmatimonadaceae bacterium]
MRILFWGTSDFAVPSLRALLGEGFEVIGVITPPDQLAGRAHAELILPPVKAVALAEGLPILQPERPRGELLHHEIASWAPDISVVASYGHILPPDLLELPPMGTINVHASLLPRLRGASPIQAAIRDGFVETGVTIMRMVPALDAGPVILQARTPIAADETYGELELRLSELGALALIEALTLLSLGQAGEHPQDETAVTYAGKITREMARITWNDGCGAVARRIRAYDPRPGAFASLRGSLVKLFGAVEGDLVDDGGHPLPGQILALDAGGMLVACAEGTVRVTEAHPSGRKRMSVNDWARGRGVAVGDLLE